MPWLGAYTASDKYPRLGNSLAIHNLCAYIVENLEFLDTPIDTLHVHVVTMHEYKTIVTVFIASVQQIKVLPM